MCGIYGLIVKDGTAPQKSFAGLTDIEYRGYDSWGIAYWNIEDRKWRVKKEVGFLPSTFDFPSSNISIGHTRWATHGGVTKENAHPHTDCSGKIALVHNGIVENYLELKKGLKTHKFLSQTDSEVVVHLIEEDFKKTKNFKKSVSNIFNRLQGLNAIVVTDGEEVVAAKNSSPLVIGKLKDGGFAIASDPNALLTLTNEQLFLDDNQLVSLNSKLELYSVKGLKKVIPNFSKLDWKHTQSSMEEYPHYMLKEINEQPKVIQNLLKNSSAIDLVAKDIKKAYGTFLVGCGTAAYACLAGVYLFSKFAKKHVNFSIGSEFNYIQDYLTKNSLLIAISQSGETIDIIEPVNFAKRKKSKIVAITNVLGSSLYRAADERVLLNAGVEKAVASTKAMIAMVSTVLLLAFTVIGRKKDGIKILEESAKEIKSVIKYSKEIKQLASQIKKSSNLFVLGRGLSYPVALESALKIKEVSYIHAEGFPSGELKHGVMALVEKGTPVIVFAPEDETREAVLANAIEVKARGAFVIGVSSKNNPNFDFFFKIKNTGASSILPNIVFAQLLAYHLSVLKGLNPDKPRNLAKSVVVR